MSFLGLVATLANHAFVVESGPDASESGQPVGGPVRTAIPGAIYLLAIALQIMSTLSGDANMSLSGIA